MCSEKAIPTVMCRPIGAAATMGPALVEELAELTSQLAEIGLDIELLQQRGIRYQPEYRLAIPILLDHLKRDYSDRTITIIASSLGKAPETRLAWPQIVAAYRKAKEGVGLRAPGDSTPYPYLRKSTLANLLVKIYETSRLDDVIALTRDVTQGPTRVFLLQLLTRSKNPKARQAIEDLAEDADFAQEIDRWRKVQAKRAEKARKAGKT